MQFSGRFLYLHQLALLHLPIPRLLDRPRQVRGIGWRGDEAVGFGLGSPSSFLRSGDVSPSGSFAASAVGLGRMVSSVCTRDFDASRASVVAVWVASVMGHVHQRKNPPQIAPGRARQ